MQIAFHVGAHCTDEDQLLKSLLKNPKILQDHGVAVPGPSKYRKLHDVEFFIALRNPATFVPAIISAFPDLDGHKIASELRLEGLIWSDVVRDIREANPDCPVTVWCNEDTPLIWPEVMHDITGIDMRILFKGGLDIIAQIMEREGVKRLRAYMAENPPVSEIQRRRVLAAFLDKYAIDEAVEEEVSLPGWTDEVVERLSQSYDDDMDELSHIPGVNFITA